MKRRTYLDTDALFAAARGNQWISDRALEVLDDPDREFVSAIFSKLEVIPVPLFNGRQAEVAFYEEYYSGCVEVIHASRQLCEEAFEEAKRCGLSGFDALHLICASKARAADLVTGESRALAMRRSGLVNVVSL